MCRQRRGGFSMHGMVWNRGVSLKMSIFTWRLLRNYVPLDSVLCRRGLPLVSRCSCCLEDEESVLHLFVNGLVAREVWGHFGNRFGILRLPLEDLQLLWMKWATSLLRLPALHIRHILPILVSWFIWQGQNKLRFEGQAFLARRVIREVVNFVHDLGRARKLEKAQFYGDLDSEWASSARSEFGEKGVLQVEALAVLEGLRVCAAKGVREVLVEVDSTVLVSLVKSSALGGWSHYNLLRQIRRLRDQVSVSFIDTFREANMVADRLAALQGYPSMVFDSVQQLPREIRGCLAMDGREFPSLRLVTC
ncbi:uncharacterized protein [Coffea arabica]|uniref:RNase H type-1 domain-containing protein n=1 Tax=Coffea arabica TaxID=13443 RepID=A0ABM4UYD6_COFAR